MKPILLYLLIFIYSALKTMNCDTRLIAYIHCELSHEISHEKNLKAIIDPLGINKITAQIPIAHIVANKKLANSIKKDANLSENFFSSFKLYVSHNEVNYEPKTIDRIASYFTKNYEVHVNLLDGSFLDARDLPFIIETFSNNVDQEKEFNSEIKNFFEQHWVPFVAKKIVFEEKEIKPRYNYTTQTNYYPNTFKNSQQQKVPSLANHSLNLTNKKKKRNRSGSSKN